MTETKRPSTQALVTVVAPTEPDLFADLPVFVVGTEITAQGTDLVQATYELAGDAGSLAEAQRRATEVSYQPATVLVAATDAGAESRLVTILGVVLGDGIYRGRLVGASLQGEVFVREAWVPVYLSRAQLLTLTDAWDSSPVGWYGGSWLAPYDTLPSGIHELKLPMKDYRSWRIGDRTRLLAPGELLEPVPGWLELAPVSTSELEALTELARQWDLDLLTLREAPHLAWVRFPAGGPWSTVYFPWRSIVAGLRAGQLVPIAAADGKTYEYWARAEWRVGQPTAEEKGEKRVGQIALDVTGKDVLVLLRYPTRVMVVERLTTGRGGLDREGEQLVQQVEDRLAKLWAAGELDTPWSRRYPESALVARPWRARLQGQTLAAFAAALGL